MMERKMAVATLFDWFAQHGNGKYLFAVEAVNQ